MLGPGQHGYTGHQPGHSGHYSNVSTMTRTHFTNVRDHHKSSKLWTPLIPHKQYSSGASSVSGQYSSGGSVNSGQVTRSGTLAPGHTRDKHRAVTLGNKVNTSIRYCHDLGRGSESQV